MPPPFPSPPLKLWHVSERPDITVFEPRLPPNRRRPGVATATRGAVDEPCCRTTSCRAIARGSRSARCLRPRRTISAHFFGDGSSRHVLAIEQDWHARAQSTPLFLYALPARSFRCVDANAGYHVSDRTVRPEAVHRLAQPLSLLAERGVALRVVPRLWPLAPRSGRVFAGLLVHPHAQCTRAG
jgi:hypothetical protein